MIYKYNKFYLLLFIISYSLNIINPMQEVATIKSWVNIHASPFAWQRILFKLLPEFKKEGFFFHTIQDDSKISFALLEKISEALFDVYKLELSEDFFNNSNQETIITLEEKSEEKIDKNQETIITLEKKSEEKIDENQETIITLEKKSEEKIDENQETIITLEKKSEENQEVKKEEDDIFKKDLNDLI